MSDVGYRCARGEDCPDFRVGFDHAHGLSGDPDALARNHVDGCPGVVEHYHRESGDLTCACGAASARERAA